MSRALALAVALAAATTLVVRSSPAGAGTNLLVGVDDDTVKWMTTTRPPLAPENAAVALPGASSPESGPGHCGFRSRPISVLLWSCPCPEMTFVAGAHGTERPWAGVLA